jgi:hypothetical protein
MIIGILRITQTIAANPVAKIGHEFEYTTSGRGIKKSARPEVIPNEMFSIHRLRKDAFGDINEKHLRILLDESEFCIL